jgi:excisionase family DNA binding protein
MNDRMITTEEAAEYAGFSVHTFKAWRRKKMGPPFVKIGRSVRYRESEVLAWVERQTQDGTNSADK